MFSIDCDGMMNICPTNARSSELTMIAPTTTKTSSLRNASPAFGPPPDGSFHRQLLARHGSRPVAPTTVARAGRQASRFSLILAALPRRPRR